MTDTDGSRRVIVVFPAGTAATMTLPNGSTQPLTTMHVRATEYTVGPNGPVAMPANLPGLSGYTYCVELSVDEAIAAGAVGVIFSQPVVTYVENFLKFPVGTDVPVGIYDRVESCLGAVRERAHREDSQHHRWRGRRRHRRRRCRGQRPGHHAPTNARR